MALNRNAKRGPRAAAAAVFLCGICAVSSAFAQESAASQRARAAFEKQRPYTTAEVAAGFFSLPAAEVCVASLDQCDQGETSVAVGIHNLYRTGAVGVGAGIVWATTLRSDLAKGVADLERDHSRRYFLVEGVFRYYALHTDTLEWWVGSTFGGVVVNDSWTVKEDREPYSDTAYVGPRAATVGTEGLASGIAFGTEWSFAPNWSFGGALRYAMWFLPETPERSPTGDYASLKGRVDMFDLGLVLAYRISL